MKKVNNRKLPLNKIKIARLNDTRLKDMKGGQAAAVSFRTLCSEVDACPSFACPSFRICTEI
ncbi:MAG TPA: class I lanthipeptide [Chitinophaga sp.]|uniref:class I lanthipeptide n=1 Tax=Chitinophaga sp. TaxID=1869181 RepID=UPI002C804891|nr:class I lanthipeptide [Chitinophaga sp.]HVI45250.1 class I lanthipeptide [Chitinophaga sp.]